MAKELNREFLNEPIFDRNCLSELVKIRKTLEDIEYILEYAHVPQYYVEKIRDANGKTISRNRVYHEVPLEHLRLSQWFCQNDASFQCSFFECAHQKLVQSSILMTGHCQ